MSPKKFARYGGLLMLVVGLLSLIPAMVGPTEGLPLLSLNTSYGAFLNLFPMNIVNKVLLILFGLGGLWAAADSAHSLPRSIVFSRIVFVAMGVAAILGTIPELSTFFGYWPLFGYEAVVHGVFAILGLYYGFALNHKVQAEIKKDPKLRATFQAGRP